MDDVTRKSLVSLLGQVRGLRESQVALLGMLLRQRDGTRAMIRAAGEALVLLARVEDPDKRRSGLDDLWTLVGGQDEEIELRRHLARLESTTDALSAQMIDLESTLESLVTHKDDPPPDDGR